VPATEGEALSTPLLGLFEKRRFRSFLIFLQDYDENKKETWNGLDVPRMTMRDLYKHFGLNEDTQEFTGHAMALHSFDSYLDQPAILTIKKIVQYSQSLARYGVSPYVYPLYGLGELPQAFSRLSAVYGGTYMLNKPMTRVVYGEDGQVVGVESEGEVAKCKMVIGDPSYFPTKVKKTGQVIRCICLLGHPVNHINNMKSGQIIIPQKQVKRNYDIYVTVLSSDNKVAPQGRFVALVSTTVETNEPQKELNPGLALLSPIDEAFFILSDTFEPLDDGTKDKVFISKSYDATSHFESSVEDVLEMYKRIMGQPLDLSAVPEAEEDS